MLKQAKEQHGERGGRLKHSEGKQITLRLPNELKVQMSNLSAITGVNLSDLILLSVMNTLRKSAEKQR